MSRLTKSAIDEFSCNMQILHVAIYDNYPGNTGYLKQQLSGNSGQFKGNQQRMDALFTV